MVVFRTTYPGRQLYVAVERNVNRLALIVRAVVLAGKSSALSHTIAIIEFKG